MAILIFFFFFFLISAKKRELDFISFHCVFSISIYYPHSHPDFPLSQPDSHHPHPDSPHSHPYFPHSYPDPPHSHYSLHSVPRFPIPAFKDSRVCLYIKIYFHSTKKEKAQNKQTKKMCSMKYFIQWLSEAKPGIPHVSGIEKNVSIVCILTLTQVWAIKMNSI